VTETIGEIPVNRLARRQSLVTEQAKGTERAEVGPEDTFLTQAKALAETATDIADLYQKREGFDGCSLKKTAGHTLNGHGVGQPTVLCLVEAPDTVDEKNTLLMGGENGALFEKMLTAIGLSLGQNTYVSSLIPWRPPGNRKPTDVEHSVCRPFWEREIHLLKPKMIILFGAGVSENVIGINALSKARGRWHAYQGIPVRVSIAPATLLKMPNQKRSAWEDLQAVAEKLKEL
jgi:DNA polymerase